MQRERKLWTVTMIVAPAASILASIVLAFYGIYFFFVVVPIAFGLPWFMNRRSRKRTIRQWNSEDWR